MSSFQSDLTSLKTRGSQLEKKNTKPLVKVEEGIQTILNLLIKREILEPEVQRLKM